MKKKIATLFFTSLILVACGGPDNTPEEEDGVSPGEHRIFITSNTFDGNMSGLTGADQNCKDRAEAAGLTKDYKAILSDGTNSAASRLVFSGAIYLVHGSNKDKIADSNTALFSADTTNFSYQINRDENGSLITAKEVWTGSSVEDGTSGTDNCTNWTSNSGAVDGEYGTNDSVDGTWIGNTSAKACSDSKHLYCISQ